MANPYHHALSSAKRWGGLPRDYLPVHAWFDASKAHLADFRHRALRHHAQGIFWAEEVFGATITLSTCARCGKVNNADHREYENHAFRAKEIPTRWVGEQHVTEDLGRIPTMADWLRQIEGQPWMNRSRRLSLELEQEVANVH